MPLKRLLYFFYEKRLENEIRKGSLPTHVGLILDGNRRYAREMGYNDITKGHWEGAKKLDDVLNWCAEFDIKVVTIWVLSTDNTQRDKKEVDGLLRVIKDKLNDLIKNPVIRNNHFRIRALGNIDSLPQELRDIIKKAEVSTRDYERHFLNIAIGYGGREEIVDAVKRFIRGGGFSSVNEVAESITPEDITRHLYTNGIPDPDLIIRTSGEVRLSGFLLWQSAYSEFYFCDALWPVFRRIDFLRAIRSYQHRNRRFGR